MAKLFIRQAKQYMDGRPTYPPELFEFIISKTPCHDLAWDVGTGTGQAIPPLAGLYKNVVGSDTSQKQLELAPKLPNVKYQHTPPLMSTAELDQTIAPKSTVDLVTVAQAMHWFDLPNFYDQVRWVLKKPNGVIATWCYTNPKINEEVDVVYGSYYETELSPYWDKARKLVEDEFRTIWFPFEPVDGLDHTGPVEFVARKVMRFEDFVMYLRSSSPYVTAKEKGVELLSDEVVEKFKSAWYEGDGECDDEKVVKFPVFLRIGKVGNICN